MILSYPLSKLVKMFDYAATLPARVQGDHNPLLYSGYEARRGLRQGVGQWASLGLRWQLSSLRLLKAMGHPFTGAGESWLSAALTMNERWTRDYGKPEFGIEQVLTPEGMASVTERGVLEKPFARLLHFQKSLSQRQPRVLVVAPMSGHYATLLRDTVETLLTDHDVYITDWRNANEVPVDQGAFGFDDYVGYLLDFLRELGPNTHLLAVCQPTVPALVATAHMEMTDEPCRPASLTLMGGPIDVGAAPTEVTSYAEQHDLAWFEKAVIARVPSGYPGAGRRVYPGFLQLAGFLAMNPEKHFQAHRELMHGLARDEREQTEKTSRFYDEYLAVCDLPAEFYLETIDRVFLQRSLATGTMTYRGRAVDAAAIRRVPLLTIEGENDDISAPGQTLAAHRICSALPAELRYQYLQTGVGHYGVFSGRRWRERIAPRITGFIRRYDADSPNEPLRSLDPPRL